jgi:molybdenum cofactor cytidylyltransferase
MARNDDLAILILAAGAASRFGSAKQLADIGGVAMARHCAQNALRVTSRVIVVTGAHATAVEHALQGVEVVIAHNAVWTAGMGGSIAVGSRTAVERFPGLRAIVVMLGDQPLVSGSDLQELIDAQHDADGIVAAFADGVVGPPCLFPRRDFADLTVLDGADGARRVLRDHAARVVTVDLPTAGVDVDTPDDHAAAVRRASFLRSKD